MSKVWGTRACGEVAACLLPQRGQKGRSTVAFQSFEGGGVNTVALLRFCCCSCAFATAGGGPGPSCAGDAAERPRQPSAGAITHRYRRVVAHVFVCVGACVCVGCCW